LNPTKRKKSTYPRPRENPKRTLRGTGQIFHRSPSGKKNLSRQQHKNENAEKTQKAPPGKKNQGKKEKKETKKKVGKNV